MAALIQRFGLALLASCIFGCWSPVQAQKVQATVLSIGDGDTIRVRQAGRPLTVRLACIDAPEMAQRPFGEQSRRLLQRRLPIGSLVRLDVKTTDRYGRLVAEVITAININLAMVEDGQAFTYRRYLQGCDGRLYLAAEQRASQRRQGIWQWPGGITRPWEFRRRPGHPGQGAGDRTQSSPSGGIAPELSGVIVADSALESAMSQDSPRPLISPMAEHGRRVGGSDVLSQLQRTRQWESDGSHLLRPAAHHAWAAAGWSATQ